MADALVQHGVSPGRFLTHWKHTQTSADVDIIVLPVMDEPAVAMFLKRSFRERWKQIDRDAMLLKYNSYSARTRLYGDMKIPSGQGLSMWSIVYKERGTNTSQQAITQARRKGGPHPATRPPKLDFTEIPWTARKSA